MPIAQSARLCPLRLCQLQNYPREKINQSTRKSETTSKSFFQGKFVATQKNRMIGHVYTELKSYAARRHNMA